MPDMRVLGRVRLSRATDESTSPERQREIIQSWSDTNGHELVGWAEDLDVSGSVDPFDTPVFGPWLTERHHEWDAVCAWKLDRLGRDAIRLNKLFGWAIEHDKSVVSATEGIDLGTPVGRLIANVIAFLAEGELEAIRERTKASQRRLRETGRWGGGRPRYGYRPVERPGGGWILETDKHASHVLLGIIDKAIAGQPLASIARELNEACELSPADYTRDQAGKPVRGDVWARPVITRLLRSKSLLGQATYFGRTVRDAYGNPVTKGPALISRDVYDRLQGALDARSTKITNRSAGASPLLGVLACPVCGRPMHIRRYPKARYYSCVGNQREPHDRLSVNADHAEELVAETFLEAAGSAQLQERILIPADDTSSQLEEAVRAYDELTALVGTTTSDTARSRLLGQISAVDARISELETQQSVEAHWELRETGETYRQAWESADTEGRRQLLLRSGITAAAAQIPGTKALRFDLRIPDDVRERLSL